MGQERYRCIGPVSLFLTSEGLFLLYYTQGVPLLFFSEEVNCIGGLIDIISGVE
jgi:hypothetical protein